MTRFSLPRQGQTDSGMNPASLMKPNLSYETKHKTPCLSVDLSLPSLVAMESWEECVREARSVPIACDEKILALLLQQRYDTLAACETPRGVASRIR